MTQAVSVTDSLKAAVAALAPVADENARLEAELLHGHVLGLDRMRLNLDGARVLSATEAEAISRMIGRRLAHEPVAYILGEAEFYGLPFEVSTDTLIPRPDTEALVEAVLELVEEGSDCKILDLGTGTGCILLSVLSERPEMTGAGLDITAGAVELAMANAVALGLDKRAFFRVSDWFEALNGSDVLYDVIVSNPPYIDEVAAQTLMPDVRDYEPVSALVGGADGLDAYRIIGSGAFAHIRPGGLLALEIGYDQGESVPALLSVAGWQDIELKQDLAGNDRVVLARAPV